MGADQCATRCGNRIRFGCKHHRTEFYPDFVALLNDERVLVVEYKGSHLVTAEDAKEKKLIGDLWADRSKGKCIFVMAENREFGPIDRAIRDAPAKRV